MVNKAVKQAMEDHFDGTEGCELRSEISQAGHGQNDESSSKSRV